MDFSTGVSPLLPPWVVLEAARGADVTRYPHPTALPLRERIAEVHGLTPDAVVAGNGSVELIWALARTAARARVWTFDQHFPADRIDVAVP